MIKVAICEDNKMEREVLQRIVEYLMQERCLAYEMEVFENGEDLTGSYSNHPFDLIFLDVVMGELDGIEVGRRIRQVDQKVEIVYCTSSTDFAIVAYEIHALGYLLKPYEPGRIGAVLDYYTQKHPQKNQKFIEVKSHRKSVIIPLKDILFMESDNKVVYIHTTTQGMIKVYNRLDLLEADVQDERFLRCHQSYFVNLQYVAGLVDSDFIMIDDSMIPIRKSGRKLIVKKYEEYLKETLQRDEKG
jgi:DNA-binding LytR/AlgR family response regulator